MSYPLISEYIEAIKAAEDNFDQLKHLRPVIGDDGLPVMTSGNFAVVFKMKDEQNGKFYAIKCFTKEQEGRAEAYKLITEELAKVDSPYILSIKYLEKELFVDTMQTNEIEFPVLLMDWVEGKTLDIYLRENLDDKYALEMLAYRFSQLAQWLIPQPFAHGDLKPDNILVKEDGTLILVDYDGMYVPAMKGQKARELGSPDFRHPLRTADGFDEHIDDFPLVSILLSLKAICVNPQLLEEYSDANRLLFSGSDYRGIGFGNLLKDILSSDCLVLQRLVSLMILVHCDGKIHPHYNKLLEINIPTPLIPIIEEVYNDEPCKFTLYDVYYTKDKIGLSFDYASFIDPSLEISNSCIVSKEIPPVEEWYMPSSRPEWPWNGTILYNSAIISCRDDIEAPVWYEKIECVNNNKTLFIAQNYQGQYGLINHKNNVVVGFDYIFLKEINNERLYFLATNPDGLSGIIDEKNNTILEFKYQIREELKGGYYLCKKNNTNLLLSLDGEEIIIDFHGTIIHFGDTAIGITSPKEFTKVYPNGKKIFLNEYEFQIFRKGELCSKFSVSFNSSWQNNFKMRDENYIVVAHCQTNPSNLAYIPDSYIDLDGNCYVGHIHENHEEDSTCKSKDKDHDCMEHKDLWLVNYIKERYLEGVQLPYNDDNMPTKYEIKIVGNMALVSYSYHSLMYPGDEGRGFLGYADENMCYW